MGNGFGKIGVCFTGSGGDVRRTRDMAAVISDPLNDLGHSFCYVGPDPSRLSSSKFYSEETTTTFPTISGASVSANTSTTPLSTALVDLYSYGSIDKASTFESSTSFASIPLQLIPQNYTNSGPLPAISGGIPGSGPLDRGFLSGPIERGFLSGPIDRGLFSGPLEKGCSDQLQRSYSHGGFAFRPRSRKWSFIRALQRAFLKTISRGQSSIVAPIRSVASAKEQDWVAGSEKQNELTIGSNSSLEDDVSIDGQNLQWAQGKAGEDRVHVVVSEDHGWVYIGIYDGFSGPDATDFLLSNLYSAVHKELRGLLWDDKKESTGTISGCSVPSQKSTSEMELPCEFSMDDVSFDWNCERKKNGYRGAANKREENQRRWKCEWERERVELDRRLKEQLNGNGSNGCATINQSDVLKALAEALRKTEEAYLGGADERVMEPELALMGSCVLVMLMKGEDVYVMNVGDSRAVLGQRAEANSWHQDLERINEEPLHDLELCDGDGLNTEPSLTAVQLTMDHSTSVEEEVERIKSEHPDDACALMNDRVKGSLKVTRAFGAGFLKQPKWNDALLEMFRIDYIGTSPYITCLPSLHHHRLGPRDRFLILSSDGLYQYFTNEEAVSEVELFIALSPEGDPAQHLVEELLFRAAKKAGMEFHELLEIPQGDRRRYHDDVSIIVISLEGRIWKSRA